jgi:hypothetical protein
MDMILKDIILLLLPYGLSNWFIQNHGGKFYGVNNKTYWSKHDIIASAKTSPQPNCDAFQNIVSVQGLGHSGASAVVDLLREVPKATVRGMVDKNYNKDKHAKHSGEINLITASGGLFEIEKFIHSKNYHHNDAIIKRFFLLASAVLNLFETESEKKACKSLLCKFILKISDIIQAVNLKYETDLINPQIIYMPNFPLCCYLKETPINQYIKYCSELLYGIFTLMGSNQLLVLDQLFADGVNDFSHNKRYIPNLKIIIVRKDPRDVFVSRVRKRRLFMADVSSFVEYFKQMSNGWYGENNDVLKIQFEDFIYRHEDEKERIFKFLGLSKEDHVNISTNLDISISSKNTGIWKNHMEYKEEIKYIEKYLSEWCYQGY